MILFIDVGNTHSVFALKSKDGTERFVSWRLETRRHEVIESYRDLVGRMMADFGGQVSDLSAVVIASVVPQVDPVLRKYFHGELKLALEFVDWSCSCLGMEIYIDHPETLGADRIVDAVAAREIYQKPCLVIDFGTATTFEVIDGDGNYQGGIIAPGVNLSMQALYQAAAKLPKIEIKPSLRAIGKNTVEAMQSGVYLGYASMIEGLIGRIENELGGRELFVIATGGLAGMFEKEIKRIDVVDQDLTLRGLEIIAHRVFGESFVERKQHG